MEQGGDRLLRTPVKPRAPAVTTMTIMTMVKMAIGGNLNGMKLAMSLYVLRA